MLEILSFLTAVEILGLFLRFPLGILLAWIRFPYKFLQRNPGSVGHRILSFQMERLRVLRAGIWPCPTDESTWRNQVPCKSYLVRNALAWNFKWCWLPKSRDSRDARVLSSLEPGSVQGVHHQHGMDVVLLLVHIWLGQGFSELQYVRLFRGARLNLQAHATHQADSP